MMAQVKLDTGIDFGEKERNASLSSMTLLQLDSKGRVFKGAESTDSEFTIIPSLSTDRKERQHPGYFVAAAHPKEGSKSLPDELFMQFGIKARINLTKAVNVVLTDRVMRQKLPSFVSNCLSAVGGFLGTFAIMLMGVEYVGMKRGHAERAADRAVACGFLMASIPAVGKVQIESKSQGSTLFVSNERICLFVTIICEDFDVKEAIEEKPAAEEESRQMKQAVVQSVSMSVALSITSCDTLALSGLLFENCAGQSASSLFIDSSSSVSLTTPIASSFSRPSQSTQKMEQTSSSAGQQVKKTITVTGLGSARSLMVMQSTAQSFAHLTDGSLSLTSLGFTETASQIGVSRQKSFFDVKGGSLRPECVEFVPPSFSGTSSFVKMSGAWILSLKSVFISRESFSSGDVVMKSVSISTAGMTGSHEVFLEGQVVGAVISDDWTSLIGTNTTMTKAQLEQVFGQIR
ncbi:hypothetical protein BLNAU_10066 [Blattamonas nauphoetae]|uniref:Uncharacterized protein n=1 Tax=Blattamonas nauphoetae TaxID=2049346 RepID=A0ABQ9XTW9_9EUKA|nr:hypothetical protein BLNAU_10066 [Blattamonas nauphoetae]